MRKKFLISIAVLAVIVLVFSGVVAMQPADFRVTRSATIEAPPEAVFAHVNDFHNWEAWSPWAKLDPQAKMTYEGPPSGEGAIVRWDGNNEVGAGSMTIEESSPHQRIQIALAFLRPFESTATAEFAFEPKNEQTVVSWSMAGKNNFIGKAISLFMDCDAMIGGEFEKGLASLKSIVETEQQSESSAAPPEVLQTSN